MCRDISVKGAPKLSASLQAWLGASAISRLGAQSPLPVSQTAFQPSA
jgi:hypothetical protein